MANKAMFHANATHNDAHGMPVAFGTHGYRFHPTPCCGAHASVSTDDGTTYCKACYAEVSEFFGGVPVEPIKLYEATA